LSFSQKTKETGRIILQARHHDINRTVLEVARKII
jgi:orotidine-5'-phosphate decarboxylase